VGHCGVAKLRRLLVTLFNGAGAQCVVANSGLNHATTVNALLNPVTVVIVMHCIGMHATVMVAQEQCFHSAWVVHLPVSVSIRIIFPHLPLSHFQRARRDSSIKLSFLLILQ